MKKKYCLVNIFNAYVAGYATVILFGFENNIYEIIVMSLLLAANVWCALNIKPLRERRNNAQR